MATERCAAQWFVAKIAEATLQSRKKRDQAVDEIEGERPSPRHEHQCDDESSNVQHELLRHEVPIELEHLVWEGDDYCENHPRLYYQPDNSICHPGNMLRPGAHEKSPARFERGFFDLGQYLIRCRRSHRWSCRKPWLTASGLHLRSKPGAGQRRAPR